MCSLFGGFSQWLSTEVVQVHSAKRVVEKWSLSMHLLCFISCDDSRHKWIQQPTSVNHSNNADTIWEHLVNDPIAVRKPLTNGFISDFWNHAPHEWLRGGQLSMLN